MAKRKVKRQSQDEAPDEVLQKWQAELVEKIRPYLIELPCDVDGEVHVALTYASEDGPQTFGVTSEFFNSDEANEFRRIVSAIEAIDTLKQSGTPTTVNGLYAAILLGRRLTELADTHLIKRVETQIAGARKGLAVARERRKEKYDRLREDCADRMKTELPKWRSKHQAAEEVQKAFCHLEKPPSIRFIENSISTSGSNCARL